jgi:hypothetical protein
MPDMQDPNCLAGFLHFVENAVGALNHPIVDLIRVSLGRLSENDLVSHAFFGTHVQTALMALPGRLRRLRVHA